MDLTQVEGLRDLLYAKTEQQRRLATRQATVRALSALESYDFAAESLLSGSCFGCVSRTTLDLD